MIQLGLLSVAFCSIILLYACYSDLKTRTVPNELWLLLIAGGLPLNLYTIIVSDLPSLTYFTSTSVSNALSSYPSLFLHLKTVLFFISFFANFPSMLSSLSLGIPASIANVFLTGMPYFTYFILSSFAIWLFTYILFFLNLFGGADAKGIISIALLFPRNPLNAQLIFDPFPFAISTLFNGAIISAVVLPLLFLYLFVHNLLHVPAGEIKEDLGLAFIGYKLRIDALAKAQYRFLRLLHSFEEEGDGALRRNFVLGGLELDEEMIERLSGYQEQGKIGEYVWVTPGLPYMLFITAGFFIALFYGNVLFALLSFFLPL